MEKSSIPLKANVEVSVDITRITKTLIDRISEAIGFTFSSHGVKKALIDGEVQMIEEFVKDYRIPPLQRANILHNWKKNVKEYNNIHNVINKSIPYLEETAEPENLDEDWLSFFFDKVRLISSEEVQEAWARILAEEANVQNRFSKSLLHSLSILSKYEAQDFMNLCRFVVRDYYDETVIQPVIFIKSNYEAYKSSRILPETIERLSFLGLATYNWEDEYIFKGKRKVIRYGNKVITIVNEIQDAHKNKKIKVGNVSLTQDGISLFSVIDKIYNSDILNFMIRKWEIRGYTVTIERK